MSGLTAQLHLKINEKLYKKIEKEALEEGLTISELCRRRLSNTSHLTQIKLKLERIEKMLNA